MRDGERERDALKGYVLTYVGLLYVQEEPMFTELKRENEEEKVAFNLAGSSSSLGPAKARLLSVTGTLLHL